jgi:hypothetical protein
MKTSSLFLILASLAVSVSGVSAATLLSFSFTSNDQSGGGIQADGSQATAPSDFNATGIASSTISRGGGASGQTLYTAQPSAFNTGAFSSSSLATAEANDDYYQFSLSNTATASLSTVNYSVYSQNNGGNPQDFSGELYYSLNNFSTAGTDLGGFTGVSSIGGGGSTYTANPESADLSGQADLQDLAADSTVTFRFYGYDGAGFTDQGFGNGGAADVTILGSVESVPEPSTCLMLLGGVTFLALGMRFRGKRA